jgi:hypothetical protein
MSHAFISQYSDPIAVSILCHHNFSLLNHMPWHCSTVLRDYPLGVGEIRHSEYGESALYRMEEVAKSTIPKLPSQCAEQKYSLSWFKPHSIMKRNTSAFIQGLNPTLQLLRNIYTLHVESRDEIQALDYCPRLMRKSCFIHGHCGPQARPSILSGRRKHHTPRFLEYCSLGSVHVQDRA